ncbi:MAG: GNAT family N-acetyltransferase [Polyangiaceae bacterium]
MQYDVMAPDDLDAVAEIEASAFAADEVKGWLETAGHDNVRVLREGASVSGALIHAPMGQFFGGRAVRAIGVAGVAVALDRRASGVGRALMEGSVRDASEQGFSLSILYPATQTLYRRAGYERAGKLMEFHVECSLIESTQPAQGLTARVLGEADYPAIEELYRVAARERDGYLDRGPYIWRRVRAPRNKVVRGVGFFDGERLESYLFFTQVRRDAADPRHNVRLTDFVSSSARGYAHLWQLLHSMRSMTFLAIFRGEPSHLALTMLREPCYEEHSERDWMIRVCDVERALTERGYPMPLSSHVGLAISDPLIPRNNGVFTLETRDGVAGVSRGGAVDAELDVRALASLFSGYHSARALRRIGALSCDDDAANRLEALFFRGGSPAMAEMF